MTGRARRIFVGLFSAFGLVVFASLLAQFIAGAFIDRNICQNAISKAFPSPDGIFEVAVEFRDCSQTGAKTEVLLYEKSNPNTAKVLVSISENERSQKPYPVPIKPTWVSANTLEIYMPQENIPSYIRTDTFGASIKYYAIGG